MKLLAARPTRDEWLLRMAAVTSARGTCLRASVGSVISKDGRIISTGYVGVPSNLPHCTAVGCEPGPDGGCIRTVHAEANAIAFSARHGISTERAELHCTHSPCRSCAKLIANAGVIRVVFEQYYRDRSGLELLDEAGIKWEQHV